MAAAAGAGHTTISFSIETGVTWEEAEYPEYNQCAEPIYKGTEIVNRITVTQISPDTFHIGIWTNILAGMYEPEDGNQYLEEDYSGDSVEPARYVEFECSSVENHDADFEIFTSNLDIITQCLGLEQVVDRVRKSTREKISSVRLVKKKKKKGKIDERDKRCKELLEEALPEYRQMIISEFKERVSSVNGNSKLYWNFAKIISAAIIQLVVVPQIPTVETKDNPHMSRRKKR